MKSSITKCRFCGKQIGIITYGIYRKVVVDAEAVVVQADPAGEEFVRVDGTKVKAVELPFMPDITANGKNGCEMAYRPHQWSCRREG